MQLALGCRDGTSRSVRNSFPLINSIALLVVYKTLRCFLEPTCNHSPWSDQDSKTMMVSLPLFSLSLYLSRRNVGNLGEGMQREVFRVLIPLETLSDSPLQKHMFILRF